MALPIIEADFIGGIWDGKSYAIPDMPEWKVAVLDRPILDYKNVGGEWTPKAEVEYDVAVYRNIGHGLFWLSRIEKR